MLCQICLTSANVAYGSLNLALPTDTHSVSHHDSLYSLYLSVGKGCWLCLQLWVSMLEHAHDIKESEGDFSERDGKTSEQKVGLAVEFKLLTDWPKSENLSTSLKITCRNGELILALRSEIGSFRQLDFTLVPESMDEANSDAYIRSDFGAGTTSTVGNPGLWCRWFQTCLESHKKCRETDHISPPFVPRRLVEISTEDGGDSFTWRLIYPADIDNVQYLTLSHCWGSSGHESLTRETHLAFSTLTNFSRLPKSFRHAFLITFNLGFRFIWIDSLCIVQDDPDDWKAQASMMGSIYQNACCNIAATWAVNGNDGCFAAENPNFTTLDLGLGHSKKYKVVPWFLYYDDIVEAPLNTRGWVAQERFLARRQLSFAKSQVYWECHELVASEQFPAGIPETLRDFSPYNQAVPPTGKPTLNFKTEADRILAWAALVDFYSGCDFTKISDKTIALAGLAEEMRNVTEDTYLAGMWKEDLQEQLCWAADFDVRRQLNRSRVPTYLAPTWSWMSVEGPVMSDMSYGAEEKNPSFVEILEASVYSEHSSKLHSFVASRLVLRGVAVWARALRTGKSARLEDDDDWELQLTGLNEISHPGIMTSVRVSIEWDENMSSSEVNPERWPSFLEERNSNLLCMFISGRDGWDVIGLLLRRLSDTTDKAEYVRMGRFVGSISDMLSTRLKISSGHPIVEDINLDNPRLADLVHTVTVV
jgi:hypothetical protein